MFTGEGRRREGRKRKCEVGKRISVKKLWDEDVYS
jgi:hypothetical protein